MFGLVRNKTSYEREAHALYSICIEHALRPVLYTDMGVSDSFDGRFEALVTHIFMIVQRLNQSEGARELSQALFDVAFANIDQSLRVAGVGDMGVPKRVKKMMLAFNTRMHAYQGAMEQGHLFEVLKDHLYGAQDTPNLELVRAYAAYMERNIEALNGQDLKHIRDGHVHFVD